MTPPMKKPSSDSMLELFERQSAVLDAMLAEYRSGRHAAMPWRVVPAARLLRIWTDAARDGFVRDAKGLDRIAETFIGNVLRIAVNNEISGHSEVTPEDALRDHLEPEEIEAFVDWAIETPTGWRISDYGIAPLFELAALAAEADDPDQKLVVLDRMLNVAHQRSDLASWFVEGGTRTLSQLHDGVRPTDRAEEPAAAFR